MIQNSGFRVIYLSGWCVLHPQIESWSWGEHCSSTLTLFEHQTSMMWTQRPPLLVLPSVSSKHGLPVGCNSLIQDVVAETGLCTDVGTTVSDFPLLCQPESDLSTLFPCDRIGRSSRKNPNQISVSPIQDPSPVLSGAVRVGWFEKCCRLWSS